MGAASSEQIHPNVNQNFSRMTVFPNENILLATANIHSQVELSLWASTLLKAAQHKHHPILLPLEFRTVSRATCGEQSVLQIRYECFFMSFEEQIEGRRESGKHFEEEELWYLLLTLAEAAEISHQLQTSLGDIKPSNVLLNKEGQIRVLTRLSKPAFTDSYDRQDPKDSLYSPQELANRRKGFKSNQCNCLVSQSFAIGMTMLAAGTITNPSSLYDYRNNEINIVQFSEAMDYWEKFQFYSEVKRCKVAYSRQLREIVGGLLQFEPERRLCSLEVSRMLQKHRQEIMTLQSFVIEDRLMKESHRFSQPKTHRLQSRRRSELRESLQSSFASPTFNNNSNDFSLQLPNAASEIYASSGKKDAAGGLSASSNKRKLSVTAFFHSESSRHDRH